MKKRWCHTNKHRVLGVVFVFLVCVLPFVSADYEENIREGIFLVEPENQYRVERTVPTFLSSEDLTFFACIEYDDIPVRLSVLCSDDNNFIDVSATRWGTESCYIGSVDLTAIDCHDAVIVADYVREGENQRLTKAVRINKVTGSLQRLLDGQYVDGGWSSALDTAFALFALKPFEDVFADRITLGMQYLKENRDEEHKCWPERQCQISTTAMIAYLLEQAEYDDESRVLRDATTYLTKVMNYVSSGETYTVSVTDHPTNENNTVNTSCVYAYASLNTTIELPKYPEVTTLTLSPDYDESIDLVCTENILVLLTSDVRGQLITYAGDNLSYTIPGPCWTTNNENVTCDVRATAFATGAPLIAERTAASSGYLADRFTTSVLGDELSGRDTMTAAVIAVSGSTDGISSEQRERILDTLLYRQTNDGSWNMTLLYYNNTSYYEPTTEYIRNFTHVLEDNVTRSILNTGFVVQALLANEFSREDEPILDAERWLSNNELTVTAELSEDDAQDEEIVADYSDNVTDIIDNPKRNAMALYVLQQNTRPFLKSEPSIIVLDKQSISIDITNPTTFSLEDLTYELPSELSGLVSIEEKDTFAPYSFRRIEIEQTGVATTEQFGYLRIKDGNDEFAKIPLIVTTAPAMNITVPSTMTVFGAAAILPINVTKSGHNFTCTFAWGTSGVTSMQSFSISANGLFNLPMQFTQLGTEEKTYSATLTCKAVSSTFTFPFAILVNRFISRPFAVSPAFVVINETAKPGSIQVKNLLDESIDVTLRFRDVTAQLDLSDLFLTLYPGESRNVTVTALGVAGENLSAVNSVIIKSFNIEERVPVTAEIIYVPEVEWPIWLRIALPVFALGVLALIGYFIYDNRAKLLLWYNTKYKREDYLATIEKNVHSYEEQETALAIRNMTAIMKMRGAADKEIRDALKEQGFTDEEITKYQKLKATQTAAAPDAKNPSAGQGKAR